MGRGPRRYRRWALCVSASLFAGCSTTTAVSARPTISFDRPTYTTGLNSVVAESPVVTVRRGGELLPAYLTLVVSPTKDNSCGAPGPGFMGNGNVSSYSGSDTESRSITLFLVNCPASQTQGGFLRGSTTITASYVSGIDTVRASATVVVQ